MKAELVDTEIGVVEDGYNSIDEMSREDLSREDNAFYDNLESDETEEENGEITKRKSSVPNSGKLFRSTQISAPKC